VLSGYLYALAGGSNWSVGLVEGIQGGAQAIVAVFAGVLADHWRRDRVLVLAGIVGLFAVVATMLTVNAYAYGADKNIQFICICIAMSCWGSYQGLWNTGVETIFADSIPSNQRSKPTTNKYILQLISTVTGPIIAIFLFLAFGDDWEIDGLRTVLMVGAGLSAPPAILLFFFNDADMVSNRRRRAHDGGVASSDRNGPYTRLEPATAADEYFDTSCSKTESKARQEGMGPASIPNEDSINNNPAFVDNDEEDGTPADLPTPSLFPSPPQSPRDGCRPSCSNSRTREEVKSMGPPAGLHQQQELPPTYDDVLDSSERARRVPYVTIVADILSGFGSGMTIKFFPLFFKNELGLSPISVNSIYVALPIFMALGSQGAQLLRRKIGRAQTCILYGYIGAIALAAMGQLAHHKSLYIWQILIPIYVLSSAQHCTRPLKKSILMDYVPKKTRARWNSIDSITRFGWSGSAVLGGYLVDHYSYSVTFTITAIMQTIAATSFFLLISIVRIEPPRPKRGLSDPVLPRISAAPPPVGDDGCDDDSCEAAVRVIIDPAEREGE